MLAEGGEATGSTTGAPELDLRLCREHRGRAAVEAGDHHGGGRGADPLREPLPDGERTEEHRHRARAGSTAGEARTLRGLLRRARDLLLHEVELTPDQRAHLARPLVHEAGQLHPRLGGQIRFRHRPIVLLFTAQRTILRRGGANSRTRSGARGAGKEGTPRSGSVRTAGSASRPGPGSAGPASRPARTAARSAWSPVPGPSRPALRTGPRP